MTSLSDVIRPRPVTGGFQLEVPEGWRQGRGAFGGLVIGSLISAIEQSVGDPRRKVRSVTAEVPGPVEHGVVEIGVELLREGKNVSTLRAGLRQHGETRCHAVAVVAADRPSASEAAGWNELTPPAAPPWASLDPLPVGAPWPEFAQHFEFRVVEGIPGTGGPARALGWIRPRDPGADRGGAYLAAMIDAWWPAALVRFASMEPRPHSGALPAGGMPRPSMRPMATITFTLEVVGGVEGLDPSAPLLYRATAPVCTSGYCLETRELWSEDGRLVAINHQTFVVIQ